MEKVGALIDRLQQQFSQQTDNSFLLNTALLLVAELQSKNNVETQYEKVAVIMPYKTFEVTINTVDKVDETLHTILENNILPESIMEPETQRQPAWEAPEPAVLPQQEPLQTQAVNMLAEEKYNDLLEEIPTLAQQQPKVVFELNDTVQTDEPSINDKLKKQEDESIGKLQGEPVKDLRKAIGINDKYLFIKELFRNDEVAYERTIKTINAFTILPEAEYWMQRELKYKLAWDDSNATVKSFYQLVKRRFS